MKPSVIITPNKDTKNRQRIANALMAQGVGTQPLGHWTQALAKVAQAYAGKNITDELEQQQEDRKTAARNTLTEALASYRGDTPNYSDQGPVVPQRGTGADYGALASVMASNPDTADMVNQTELSNILTTAGDYKVPTGYMKAPGGGIQQIPGWVNTGRYKPYTYTDEGGNLINAMVDVAHIAGQGGQKPQPGALSVGPDGTVNLGTKTEKSMTVEAGTKAAMMQQAMKDLQSAQPLLFNEDGTVNRMNAANAWINTPGTDGRLVYSYYFNAINAKLRAESGAAVPEEEVRRGMKVFMPSPLDNDKTAQEKIQRLHQFMNTALANIDSTGRLVPQDTDLATWMKNEQQKVDAYESLPRPQTQADFEALPAGTVYVDPDDGKRYRK